MVHSMNDNSPLSSVNVLVVEDDLFLAMALEDTLVGMGAVVVEVPVVVVSADDVVDVGLVVSVVVGVVVVVVIRGSSTFVRGTQV